MFLEGWQVLVAGDDTTDTASDRRGEHSIVVRIAAHGRLEWVWLTTSPSRCLGNPGESS